MIITYKPCELGDLQILISIAKTTFIAAFEKQNNPSDFQSYLAVAFSEEQLKRELAAIHSVFYLAYIDDTLVGYFKLNEKEAQSETFKGSAIELERIYVIDTYQNQRIGSQLLVQVIEMAKSKKVDFVWLGVWEKNVAALRFYERYGFVKFGSHAYYIGTDKQTDWLLKLVLT